MIIDKMDRSNNIAYLQEFFNRTQKNGESVDDYPRTLKKAYNKAFKASMSEDANKALLGRFRTGIIPEIQSIMCTTEPKSYDEAVEMANKIERSLELKIDTMNINRVDHDQFRGISESKDYSTKTWTGLRKRDNSPFRNGRNLKIEKQRYEGSSNNQRIKGPSSLPRDDENLIQIFNFVYKMREHIVKEIERIRHKFYQEHSDGVLVYMNQNKKEFLKYLAREQKFRHENVSKNLDETKIFIPFAREDQIVNFHDDLVIKTDLIYEEELFGLDETENIKKIEELK
ncbi:hypothetical protein BpHYR1_036025, partial [Brachionus plicatilis]